MEILMNSKHQNIVCFPPSNKLARNHVFHSPFCVYCYSQFIFQTMAFTTATKSHQMEHYRKSSYFILFHFLSRTN